MEQSITSVAKRGKTNGYNSTKIRANRKRKENEAIKRQVTYEALSVPNRLAVAQSRRGESKREVARLQALLAAPKRGSNVKAQ